MENRHLELFGRVYDGECENGLPHGKGRLTLDNGEVYEGTFIADSFTGEGRHIISKHAEEVGFFKNYQLNGKGRKSFLVPEIYGYDPDGNPKGFIYEGEFLEGELHGHGRKIGPNGTIEEGVFEYGEWVREKDRKD